VAAGASGGIPPLVRRWSGGKIIRKKGGRQGSPHVQKEVGVVGVGSPARPPHRVSFKKRGIGEGALRTMGEGL